MGNFSGKSFHIRHISEPVFHKDHSHDFHFYHCFKKCHKKVFWWVITKWRQKSEMFYFSTLKFELNFSPIFTKLIEYGLLGKITLTYWFQETGFKIEPKLEKKTHMIFSNFNINKLSDTLHGNGHSSANSDITEMYHISTDNQCHWLNFGRYYITAALLLMELWTFPWRDQLAEIQHHNGLFEALFPTLALTNIIMINIPPRHPPWTTPNKLLSYFVLISGL